MYTIYPTVVDAIVANVQAAAERGCNMVSTIEWFVRINHPTDGRAALKDETGPITHAELEADGWFPAPSPSVPVDA